MEHISSVVKITKVSNNTETIANDSNFIVKSFQLFGEVTDDSKTVKVASIQIAVGNGEEKSSNIFQKVEKMIEAAGAENVNILCLPELWYMPYPFYTPDSLAWKEFAEDGDTGASSIFIKNLAAKFNMVIISSILERDSYLFFNTTLVISTSGSVIGKYRKIHIPPIEKPFLQPGDFNHPVIHTEFGRIGILICYERHFPLCWMMYGLQDVDIVFNPSAEDEPSLSERLWFAEGLNAAVSNSFFTVMVNRTGTETFSDGSKFCYFGSNYVCSPYGYKTPHLPKDRDGMLITELDINDCRKAKTDLSIHQNSQLNNYISKLNEIKHN
ncbi:Beta-ureidopropionase [Pseudolycoriella hygida]|uniref:Beta-ureidopropionase n=1 Tax=Pseudolycoriella hygida TaxID=35572 RepID=A0A9Q0MPR2_9DIPT|nr:Beta-ureidopropionase [Pseudolycoriella hygida]